MVFLPCAPVNAFSSSTTCQIACHSIRNDIRAPAHYYRYFQHRLQHSSPRHYYYVNCETRIDAHWHHWHCLHYWPHAGTVEVLRVRPANREDLLRHLEVAMHKRRMERQLRDCRHSVAAFCCCCCDDGCLNEAGRWVVEIFRLIIRNLFD